MGRSHQLELDLRAVNGTPARFDPTGVVPAGSIVEVVEVAPVEVPVKLPEGDIELAPRQLRWVELVRETGTTRSTARA